MTDPTQDLSESECNGVTTPADVIRQYDAMTAQDKAREFHRNNDQRAMDAQLQAPASWGLA